MEVFTISTNKNELDVELIHDFISNSYWGMGRRLSQVKNCIDHSLNFGLYKDGEQIGYARVVTDYTIFACLYDVFVVERERGKGYGGVLLDHIMGHPELTAIENWKLTTADAHGLYKKYGFETIREPWRIMERVSKAPQIGQQ